jgi:neuromedin U receptor 1
LFVSGLPPELYTVWEAYPWRFGEAYCLFKTFLTELVSSASVLTIMAFTVERYVAICHPLRAQTLALSSPSRVAKVILVIWTTAAVSALPYPINTRTYHYLTHPTTNLPLDDSLVCNIPFEWMPTMKHVIQVRINCRLCLAVTTSFMTKRFSISRLRAGMLTAAQPPVTTN